MSSSQKKFADRKGIGHFRVQGWTVLVVAIAAAIASPVVVVLSSIFFHTPKSAKVWGHLSSTVLGGYIANSLWLMLGVTVGVLTLGVGTAWLVTMCRFPGSRWFEWALLLPLAAPAYLLAYTYTELLDFYGPVQRILRAIFGWSSVNDYWFPNIRSLWGAIVMMSLVLYPYVYLLARVAFLEQSVCTLEASRSLGRGPWASFATIALPLARPAIAAGLALALMEALNDFGTVQHFGVNTLTTGIYRTWVGMDSKLAASQLASVLMLFIFGLIILERWSRSQSRYYQTSNSTQKLLTYSLFGLRATLASLACLLPVTLGLLLPAAELLRLTVSNASDTLDKQFWILSKHSLILAGITAAIAVMIAIIMAYGLRLNGHLGMRLGVRIASMGYAVSGLAIAAGIARSIGQIDKFSIFPNLRISGTISALVLAYLVRFLAISFNTVDSGLAKIKPNLDDAARSLGYSPTATLLKVHAPMMRGSLLTAALLVFVDVMKELSATLMLRPFNFDTLATQVYRYASDERLAEASGPALAIVLVGILPVMLLSWRIARSRSRT